MHSFGWDPMSGTMAAGMLRRGHPNTTLIFTAVTRARVDSCRLILCVRTSQKLR